jgi:hypothetical protein
MMDVAGVATGATGSEGALAAPAGGRPAPLSAAERMRRSRARRRAELLQRRMEEAQAPLRLALAAQAEADLALIEQHLADEHRGLALAERVLEGAKAVILRLYGHPLLRLAETAMAPPEVLAARLGCTKLEAARLIQEAGAELRDRLFGKPAPVKGGSEAPPIAVQLNITPGMAAPMEAQADQALGEGEPCAL